ncbi:A24 family peptidase [Pusillimonas minor]|uniref:Prepilin peptidase n=1 Tax=Pusillimonas minor TaxID=2697024 RepID=A0A842HJL3_9BURK|nr:prepilin peptidase [Pusillimonas minor]MBC2768466.1 prepilin peptidase [Pusillimonas minor]
MVGLLSVISATLLFSLSGFDLKHRRLPNIWVGAYAFLFLPFAIFSGFGWSQLGWHVLAAAIAFVVTSIFFALRWMGGGDVKLWAAIMLWAGPHLALPVVIIATLAGGIVGMLSWLARWQLRRSPQCAGRKFLRLWSADRGVPYGVALSLAGVFVLYAYAKALMPLN